MINKTKSLLKLKKDIEYIKNIANKILLENQELKRTIEFRDLEIDSLKDLLKIKQDEIYTLQSRLIQKEMEK